MVDPLISAARISSWYLDRLLHFLDSLIRFANVSTKDALISDYPLIDKIKIPTTCNTSSRAPVI